MIIVPILSGIALGLAIIVIMQLFKIGEMLEDVCKAEDRAIRHFNKLCTIEKILKDMNI